MINKLIRRSRDIIQKIDKISQREHPYDLKNPKVIMGKILAEFNKQKQVSTLSDVEFQVFSQFGDDGIIQYLIDKVEIPNKTFIEFGVEDYKESNTRYLLINNNWSGFVIDGSEQNVAFIKEDAISMFHDIHSKHAFITRENINGLLAEFIDKGYDNQIGILSIDIDGNDYWVWKEITVVSPIIVVIEYNAVFGLQPWTVPYKADFYRLNEHFSHQYWGASLSALTKLAKEKGYSFVGCNSAGNNAYFVRNDKVNSLKVITPEEGYVESKFREDHFPGSTEPVFGKHRLELINGMPVYNVETDELSVM